MNEEIAEQICHECADVVTHIEPNSSGTARFNRPCGHLSEPPAPTGTQYGLSLDQLRALCDEAQRRAKPGVRPSLALALSGYRAGRRIDLAPGLSGKAIAYRHPKGTEATSESVTETQVRVFVDDVRRWLRKQEAK